MNEIIEKESIKVENVNTLKDYNLRILGNTEQDGTPTPENPVNIRVVTGEQNVEVCGKNLLDFSVLSWKTNNISPNNETIDQNQIKITFVSGNKANYGVYTYFPAIIYTLSKKNKLTLSMNISSNKKVMLKVSIENIFDGNLITINANETKRLKINTFTNLKAPLVMYLGQYISEDINVTFSDFQIELGDTMTDYKPYQGSTYPLSLNNIELCRIGDHQDYIYKKDDKWWKHKEIDKKELSINNWKIDDVVNGIYQYSFPSEVKVDTKSADPLVLSKYYKGVPFMKGNIASWEEDNTIVTVASTGRDIRIMTSKQTNLDDFKAFIKNKDLGIRAVLPSAVEEQITDTTLITQLNNLNNAILYSGENNIITTISPLIDGEGTSITLENTANIPFNNIILKGNTKQQQYSGKNLVPITAQSVENNGVTFTINNNQLTINGTATDYILFFLNNNIWRYSANNPILEAGTYNFSFNNEVKFSKFSKGGICITIYNENSKIIYEKASIKNNFSFSISEKGSCTIRIEIMKGQVFDNNDLQLQIEQGSTATDYEPYVGGTASPNPDYPQDIKVVSGDNTIKISNSNNTLSQSFPISLGSLELCKIGDYQDYIYKKDDKWWKHKEIDKKELSINNWKIDDVVNGIYQYSFPSEVKVDTKSADPLVLSKYYKGVPFMKGNIASWEEDNTIVTVASTGRDIRIMTSKQTNLDDFKAFIKNKDLGIRAVLPSAVEEQITDTTLIAQLNNLSKATTYAGETNIVATSDGNNLPVTNYIKAYSSEIINESYPYLDLKYNLPYTEKLENLDFYLNENGRLVIKNVGTYLCSISESEIPDMPEASETTVKIAGRDGDLVLATTYNPIQFSIVIYTDENLSPAEKIEERQKIYKFFHEMKNTFKTFGIEAASKFYRVKYAGDVECENHPKHLKFTLPFKSSVSYGYNFKDKELIGNNIAISNTIEPVGFKCIINGPATNPTISLNNNEMKYEASIVNNEKIIIDTNNSTVTSITDNNESNAIVHYNRVFPKIQNGKNELKILSGIDNPTQVKIEWNDYNL